MTSSQKYFASLSLFSKSLETPHRHFNLYHRDIFTSFFYSEIEKKWLIIIKNGHVKINGKYRSNIHLLDNTSKIQFGDIEIVFKSTGNGIGLSQSLIHKFLASCSILLPNQELLDILAPYGPLKPAWTCVRNNPLFIMENEGVRLNYSVYTELLDGKLDPLVDSMLSEFENSGPSSVPLSFKLRALCEDSEFTSACNGACRNSLYNGCNDASEMKGCTGNDDSNLEENTSLLSKLSNAGSRPSSNSKSPSGTEKLAATPYSRLDTSHSRLDTPHSRLDTPHSRLDTPHARNNRVPGYKGSWAFDPKNIKATDAEFALSKGVNRNLIALSGNPGRISEFDSSGIKRDASHSIAEKSSGYGGNSREHNDVYGNEHNDVYGNEHNDVYGNEHNDVYGNEHNDVYGNEHNDVYGHEHNDVYGHEHNSVYERGYSYGMKKYVEQPRGDVYVDHINSYMAEVGNSRSDESTISKSTDSLPDKCDHPASKSPESSADKHIARHGSRRLDRCVKSSTDRCGDDPASKQPHTVFRRATAFKASAEPKCNNSRIATITKSHGEPVKTKNIHNFARFDGQKLPRADRIDECSGYSDNGECAGNDLDGNGSGFDDEDTELRECLDKAVEYCIKRQKEKDTVETKRDLFETKSDRRDRFRPSGMTNGVRRGGVKKENFGNKENFNKREKIANRKYPMERRGKPEFYLTEEEMAIDREESGRFMRNRDDIKSEGRNTNSEGRNTNSEGRNTDRDTRNADRDTRNADRDTRNADRDTRNADRDTRNADRDTRNASNRKHANDVSGSRESKRKDASGNVNKRKAKNLSIKRLKLFYCADNTPVVHELESFNAPMEHFGYYSDHDTMEGSKSTRNRSVSAIEIWRNTEPSV